MLVTRKVVLERSNTGAKSGVRTLLERCWHVGYMSVTRTAAPTCVTHSHGDVLVAKPTLLTCHLYLTWVLDHGSAPIGRLTFRKCTITPVEEGPIGRNWVLEHQKQVLEQLLSRTVLTPPETGVRTCQHLLRMVLEHCVLTPF